MQETETGGQSPLDLAAGLRRQAWARIVSRWLQREDQLLVEDGHVRLPGGTDVLTDDAEVVSLLRAAQALSAGRDPALSEGESVWDAVLAAGYRRRVVSCETREKIAEGQRRHRAQVRARRQQGAKQD